MRAGTRSAFAEVITTPTSTFAASGCGAVASPAARRTRKLRRGRIVRITAAPPPATALAQRSTSTQSPTVGSARLSSA